MGNIGAEPTLEVAEMAAKIVDWRRQRMSYTEIGKALGIHYTRARTIYYKALADIPRQHVDEHRAEELLLIDDATADLMIIATSDNVSPRTRIEAWGQVRGWAERKAKLLGLDAPTQIVTIDRVDQEIAALERELQQLGETEAAADAKEQAEAAKESRKARAAVRNAKAAAKATDTTSDL